MFKTLFKKPTPLLVMEDLLDRAESDVQQLHCILIRLQDSLAFYQSSLQHAKQRVVDLNNQINQMQKGD